MAAIIRNGQSLLDLAVQEAGSLEAAFDLAVSNDLSLTDELNTGQTLTSISKTTTGIADYYANNKINPATGLTTPIDTGINYMEIEFDFIVS